MAYFNKKNSTLTTIVGVIAVGICSLAYTTQSIDCIPNAYCTIKEGSVLDGYYTTKINRRDISILTEKKYNTKQYHGKYHRRFRKGDYLKYAPVITLKNNTEIELQNMEFNTPEAAEALVTDIQLNKRVRKRGIPVISSFGIYY